MAFLEGALPDTEMGRMRAHASTCAACIRHDHVLRQGLLIARNLPPVEPSTDFYERLTRKLSQLERADARAAVVRGPGLGSFLVGAFGLIAAGLTVVWLSSSSAPPRPLSLPPVVAMRPALPPLPMASSRFVASAAAGMPVWPAALMAEQAPVHFVNAEWSQDR